MGENEIRDLLGIGEKDSIEDAVGALQSKASKVDELTTAVDELKQEVADIQLSDEKGDGTVVLTEEVEGLRKENLKLSETNATLQTEVTTMGERVKALEDSKHMALSLSLVEQAIKDRKITPAEGNETTDAAGKVVTPPMRKLAFSDPDVFKAVVAARPEIPLNLTIEEGSERNNDTKVSLIDEYWDKVEVKTAELMTGDGPASGNITLAQAEARRLIRLSDLKFTKIGKVAANDE